MKLKITLVKSTIASLKNHKANVEALGLRKVGQSVVLEDSACVRGKIAKVNHLVTVEEVK